MGGRRCAAAGCGRFVPAGESRCGRHRAAGAADAMATMTRSATGDEDEAAATEDAGEERRRAAAAFARRLAQGDYRALFDPRLSEVLAQAAAERSLADEIGALRFVLARLLAEEQDLTKLATHVASVTRASIQAARAQRAISGELADSLTAAVTQILAELDETE